MGGGRAHSNTAEEVLKQVLPTTDGASDRMWNARSIKKLEVRSHFGSRPSKKLGKNVSLLSSVVSASGRNPGVDPSQF